MHSRNTTNSSFASSFSTLTSSSAKSQQYLDSLIPPSREQFERIALVQEEKEEEIRQRVKEQKRRSHHEIRRSLQSNRSDERSDAARVIQKTFRGYRARREMDGFTLDPSTRWITAIREAQFRETTRPRGKSFTGQSQDTLSSADMNDVHAIARSNWKKLGMIALRAGHDDEEEESDSDSSCQSTRLSPREREELRKLREEANAQRRSTALTLGLQYWLEIVDQKHRYGTNLRMYHEEWRKADTNENFFYWLDYGEGRYISLDTCPRDRLERDQVRYLSREERQYYLATVDDQGRLCWAKNGEPIDTSEKYRDSIYGIVPVDDPAPPWRPAIEPNPYAESSSGLTSSSSASYTDPSHEQHRADKHKHTTQPPDSRDVKKVKQFSATSTLNKLLRKTVKDGTWIFVADTSFRLYIGIKQAGAFQHSSFLQGARISAGGLIGIKEGKLTFLSPLSGHYRPPTSNFRAFVRSLKAEGVDVGHVPISKAYAVLLGLETYTKTRRVGKDLVHRAIHGKNKAIHPKETKKKEEEQKDTSKSAQKERQVVEMEKRQTELEKQAHVEETAIKALKKLHLVPTAGQASEKRSATSR